MGATGFADLMGILEAATAAYGAAKVATAGHGGALAGAVGNSRPGAPPPPPSMPSIQQTDQAQLLQESQDAAARYGRNATILTNNQGTGDKLGP